MALRENREDDIKPLRPETHVTLMLWDTAGEERFRSVAPCLLHGAQGIILVFSLTERESFLNLQAYYNIFRETVPLDDYEENQPYPILLVGNKVDLIDDSSPDDDEPKSTRQVQESEIKEWMEANNVAFYSEVSAKTGVGIKEAIEKKLVKYILKKYFSVRRPNDLSLQISIDQPTRKKNCC